MERRELRHDRHTVSLLANHVVFSPKQPREILVGDVALALDGIICKINYGDKNETIQNYWNYS